MNVALNDATKVGIYNLKVTGTVGLYATANVIFTVTVNNNVVGNCATTTISTMGGILAQSYQIGTTALIINYTDWTESVGICGPFTYTSTYSNGSALTVSSLVIFDGVIRSYTIYTMDTTMLTHSPYTVKLLGTLSNALFSNISFVLTLVDPCQGAIITPSTPDT